MKSIMKYAVLFAMLLTTATVDATPTTTQRATQQPLIGIKHVKIQYYKPVNQHVNETKTFVRWVNIIKASQRVTRNRASTNGTK